MPLKKWIKSANYAIEGILHAAKTQRHMRYHLIAAIIVLITGFVTGIGWTDFVVLMTLAIVVISVEMINSSIETITDVLFKEYDPKAKAIKDMAAGAVLIAAIGSVIIGYVILFNPVKEFFQSGLQISKHVKGDIAVVSIVMVLILVVVGKTFFKRGKPLQGGMPSGHAAVGFSIWMIVTLISQNFTNSILVLILAVLIAQSRVSKKIHRPLEVIVGALLGTIVTFLLFQIFAQQ